jgi:uncharacterized protein (DUF305 family)
MEPAEAGSTEAMPTDEGMMDETDTGSTGMMGDVSAEVLFIDGMIPHHEQAIAMAQRALEEAEHEELRELAQDIIDEQQKEIDQMQEWRDSWYPDVEPTMGMQIENMPMMEDMMLSIDESIPFDLRFIDAMTIHHGAAILMAQGLLAAPSEHEELRDMAQQMIDSQQKEIDQMRQWREEWYPDALP